MTKKARLRELLRHRWVTVQVAMRCVGINSLSQRVTEWERTEGLAFERRWVEANGSRCLAYRLAR